MWVRSLRSLSRDTPRLNCALSHQQIIVLTPAGFEIYDVRTFKLVEREPFEAWSLVSPILSHTTNGTLTYSDAVSEVAHSVRVYKGKVFLLVCPFPAIK